MNSPISNPGPGHFRQQQAMNENYIVIEDPAGEYWEGSIIKAEVAKMLDARGVVSIPFEPSLTHLGNGGFAMRKWGAGYPLNTKTPRMTAPLTVFCVKKFLHLTWRARLMPEDDMIQAIRDGSKLEGMLRLSGDTSAPATYVATLSSIENPVQISQLGALDEHNGWMIGGSAQINIPQEGHYSFALYGMAPGVRVIWVAASTSANP